MNTVCKLLLLCLWVGVVGFAGCTFDFVGEAGSGVKKTETRDVEPFDQIEASGAATVNVHFGKQPSLTITTDDNLLELIETKVSDGKLTIQPIKSISPRVGVLVDVTTTDLKSLEGSGAVEFNVRSAKLDSLTVRFSGASTLTADGTANKLDISVSGSGKIDAENLKAKTVKFSLTGAGTGKVYASDSLDASISGAARLTYFGNPHVTQEVSGVGSVVAGDAAESVD